MKNKFIIIFLISVFVSSVSQVILKQSTQKKYKSIIFEYLNPRVITAYSLFFGSTLLTVIAYKNVPLSLGAILEATGYIWVTLLGMIFLKEHISFKKWMGLLIIVTGITVFNIG